MEDNTDRSFISATDKSRSLMGYLKRNKILDNLADCFCFVFFSLCRLIYSRNKKTNNIVIINLNRLGDTVFTIPAINIIVKHFYPSYNITIVSYPDSKDILKQKYDKGMLVTIDKESILFQRRIANRKARMVLKKLNPEIIFDLNGSILSASLLYNSAANKIFGAGEKYYKYLYTKHIPLRTNPHLIDRYLDVVNLYIDFQRDNNIYEHKINFHSEGDILIHPFAIRSSKEWNFIKYIKLAETLSKVYKVKLIIPSGYLEPEALRSIEELKIPVAITHNIDSLVEEIKGASLYISNDSGPLYIANMLGIPTFTIYGPTNPDYSVPFGPYNKFIRKLIKCSPIGTQYCFTQGGIHCPLYECMNTLSYEEVLEEVNSFISFIKIKHMN
jgi:heptosyltransferase-2